jgi:hypothetical protein
MVHVDLALGKLCHNTHSNPNPEHLILMLDLSPERREASARMEQRLVRASARIVIFKPDDVIFAQVLAVLDFDDDERNHTRIF